VVVRGCFASRQKYALFISQVIMMLLENYTEITHELPKLDQVAVPNLQFLAIENWGIVTEKFFLTLLSGITTHCFR